MHTYVHVCVHATDDDIAMPCNGAEKELAAGKEEEAEKQAWADLVQR